MLCAGARAEAEGAGEAGEAYCGDGCGVCAEGGEAGAVFCAFEVEGFFGGAVYADEGVVGFAA